MKSVLTFIAGLAIGTGVSWVYHKNKYETMINEEMDELRDHIQNREKNGKEVTDICEESIKEELESIECDYMKEENRRNEEYDEILLQKRYTNSEDAISNKSLHVVAPDDFASVPGFDTDTFYYYANDIITDDNNEIVDESTIRSLFGMTAMEIKDQFGVYEDDSVFIRNSDNKCDYEILRDEEDYVKRNCSR